MAERYAVVGPPGTGKTTYLKRQVENAAAMLGSEQVMVCSLTKAAAAEIRGRNLPIRDDQCSTLHSFAFRALGCPTIAESMLADWNAAHPALALSSEHAVKNPEADKPDAFVCDGPGDAAYEHMNILRHERVPEALWPAIPRAFAKRWREWKADNGYEDFTGLIETALNLTDNAPCAPLAMFIDEAQDMSRLEVDLLRKWSADCTKVIAVGDPAQALYEWRGASAEAFFDVGHDHRRVLSQSYRVPVTSHGIAVRWAGALLDGIDYRPTDIAGSIQASNASIDHAPFMLKMIEEHLSDPNSGALMAQALCSYMINPLIAALRDAGIPFHNPMRRHRRDWNPLWREEPRKGSKGRISTIDRLKAYLAYPQTAETIRLWLPLLKSDGILVRGAGKIIKDSSIQLDDSQIAALFVSDDVLDHALSGSIDWLRQHVSGEYKERIKYPLNVIKRRGLAALDEPPRVMVGTIHSFKGGEGDTVITAPDLSPAAYLDHHSKKNSVRRAFYVALTRSRNKSVLLAPANGMAVRWPL